MSEELTVDGLIASGYAIRLNQNGGGEVLAVAIPPKPVESGAHTVACAGTAKEALAALLKQLREHKKHGGASRRSYQQEEVLFDGKQTASDAGRDRRRKSWG